MPNKVCKRCEGFIYWSGVWGVWVHLTSLERTCDNRKATATPKEK